MSADSDSRVEIARYSELVDRQPTAARVNDVDLVVIRYDDAVSVMFGRCPHRGAPMHDATVKDRTTLVCAAHCWDFSVETGISPTNGEDHLHLFQAIIDREADTVSIDPGEIEQWKHDEPQTFNPDEYLGG